MNLKTFYLNKANFKLENIKPILSLLLLTPVLTEVLTNNIPAGDYFKLSNVVFFSTVVYGPVLLLRELAVRWRLSLVGYILLGIVYGFYNEGILAKTFFRAELPNPHYNGYGVLLGVNFPWVAIIILFHAFFAFLFPVLIVNYLFPKTITKPWINTKVWLIISTGLIIYVSMNFLKQMNPPITVYHFCGLILIMGMLIFFSKDFKEAGLFDVRTGYNWYHCLYGFVFVIALFTVSDIMITSHLNPILYLIYVMGLLFFTLLALSHKPTLQSLLVFGLSSEIAFSGCVLLVAIVGNVQNNIYSASLFIFIFLAALIVVIYRKRNDTIYFNNEI